MQFGSVPVEAAHGAILVHAVRAAGRLFKKGRLLSDDDIAALRVAQIPTVVVARLDTNDVPEDEAAARLAALCTGEGGKTAAAFTGRANIYAARAGLALIDAPRVDALNAIDEAVTLATITPFSHVTIRQMLATVKIIPFAVPKTAVEEAERLLSAGPLVHVVPFLPKRIALISTTLPSTNPAILDKNRAAIDARLEPLGSRIVIERRVAHVLKPLSIAIAEARAAGPDPILIFGASAITDRRDVIPAAIEQAGGTVEAFGMPVDPGNLLLLGHLAGTTIIGLPGCARSPKLNGFDFVLWRILANQPLSRTEIAKMGVGGLLTEIPTRPQPREEQPTDVSRAPKLGAVVLAAGLSARMGTNKLLMDLAGKPMIRRVVEAASRSHAEPVVVVTGNAADEIKKALRGLDIKFVNNPDFSKGLSTSLKAGLNTLPEDCDGAVILLGDMPGVESGLINRLIAAFDPNENRTICVAARRGKRGNPVLWARRFFPEMQMLEGDIGAKHLLAAYDDLVCEIEAEDDAPLTDLDTPDAVAAYRARL